MQQMDQPVLDAAMSLLGEDELLAAARWTFTQDVSDGFRQIIREVLLALGYGNLINQL